MKINYPHVLNRICAPLAIRQREFQSILGFLGPRMGVDFHVAVPVETDQASAERSQNFGEIPENIAVVEVTGPLVRKASGMDAWCGMASYEQIERDFMRAMEDPRKKGFSWSSTRPAAR